MGALSTSSPLGVSIPGGAIALLPVPGVPWTPAAGGTPPPSPGSIPAGSFAPGAIVNADINATAGIVKTKLAALGIVDADVAAGAAIAGSKLNGTIRVAATTALRMIAGAVSGAGAITSGTGDFTINRTGVGVYVVTFTTPFTGSTYEVSITTQGGGVNLATPVAAGGFTANLFTVAVAPVDTPWYFQAVGPQ